MCLIRPDINLSRTPADCCRVNQATFVRHSYRISPPPNNATAPSEPMSLLYRAFSITLRHTVLCRTPMDERSASRTDRYLTSHNTPSRQTPCPRTGSEPVISASGQPQIHALDRAVTWIGQSHKIRPNIIFPSVVFYIVLIVNIVHIIHIM